jgi:cell division septation protein DedD
VAADSRTKGRTPARSQGKGRRQGASRRSTAGDLESRGRLLRWYGGGVVTGVLASFLVYLATLPGGPAAETPAAKPAAATEPAAEPRYEFFEVLPRQTIEVDVDPAEVAAQRGTGDDAVYLLQAGSFRRAEDADQRRAELLLLGLEPRVEETSGSNGRWYRVLLGPFPSRSRMAAARSLTAQQNIDTLLMRRSAEG